MANKVITISGGRDKPAGRQGKDPDATYIDLSLESSVANGRRRLDRLVDTAAVRNAMHNIFTWIPGERILDPEFGNTVRKYIYEGNTDITAEDVMREVQTIVSKYEPRVEIDSIGQDQQLLDKEAQRENNELDIKVVYHVVGLPDEKFSISLIL